MRVTLLRAERTIGNAMTAIVVVNGAITRLLLGEILIMITERRGVTEGIEMIIIREIRRQRNLPTRLIEIIQNKGEGKMLHMLGLP
jgi:imidazole glycerol phosphate synthase subunit HisF